MIIKDAVTIFIRGKPCLVGNIHNDKTGTFLDGDGIVTKPYIKVFSDPVGNTFAIGENGSVYQIEFWEHPSTTE